MDKTKKKVSKKKVQIISDKQKRFCLEYVKDYNGTQAAIRAGYSKKTANEQASRLLTNVNISKYLAELKEEIKDQTLLTINHLDESIYFMVEEAKKIPIFNDDGKLIPKVTSINFRGLGKGLELYGKRLAAYSDKLDHSNKDGTLKPVIYLPDNGRDKKE